MKAPRWIETRREERRNRITTMTGVVGTTLVKTTHRGGKVITIESWTPKSDGSHRYLKLNEDGTMTEHG